MQQKLAEYAQRHRELEQERESWKKDWRELSRYFLPRKCRFLEDGDRTNEGGLQRGSLDSTGIYALRDLAAGLHGGMTSPARPWFKLSLQNSELDNAKDARLWLDEVERRMRDVLHRSNFYNAIHQQYEELAAFGTAFMFELPDARTGVRFHTLTIGEYCLDTDEHGRVDTVFRNMDMTLRQMVRKFGLDALPEGLRDLWRQQTNWNTRFNVVHAVFPRDDRDMAKIDARNKPWASIYYLDGHGAGHGAGYGGEVAPHLLSEGGYDEFPGFGVRWDVTGGDVYGRGPGMDTLPDCVLLQSMTTSMLKALHKEVDPPMIVAGDKKDINLLPGGVTFTNAMQNQGQGVYPALQLRHNIQGTAAAIGQIQNQVREGLFSSLFRMLLDSDRRNITAREVAAKEEEKMILIGPVLERLHDELLIPIVTRTFNIMAASNFLPGWPEELGEQPIKVDFVSLLAQAQKMVSTGAIERYVGFIGQCAQMNPEILDSVDADKLADAYGDYLGVDAKIIRSQEEREQLREEREQTQAAMLQQQQQMAAAQMMMQGAKSLGQAKMGGGSALDALARMAGAGAEGGGGNE